MITAARENPTSSETSRDECSGARVCIFTVTIATRSQYHSQCHSRAFASPPPRLARARDVRLAFVVPVASKVSRRKSFPSRRPCDSVSVSVRDPPHCQSHRATLTPRQSLTPRARRGFPLPPRPLGHPRRPARLRPAALGADNTRRLDARRRVRQRGSREEGTALPSRPSPVLSPPPTGLTAPPFGFGRDAMAPNASEIGPPNIPAKFVGPAPATGAAPAARAPSDTSPSICVRRRARRSRAWRPR